MTELARKEENQMEGWKLEKGKAVISYVEKKKVHLCSTQPSCWLHVAGSHEGWTPGQHLLENKEV